MHIPDNYDIFMANERRKERLLERLPICVDCKQHILQERAVCLDGVWFCDECLETNRKDVEIYV